MRYLPLLLILLCAPVGAATYYVDFDGGSDSNNGTSTGTPFKHCPDDPNATNTANGVTLAAGDTVIFKGGVVYRGSMAPAASGSDGNPITYDGNSAGTWGTGKAILDGSAVIGTSWTQCTNSADAGGNVNYANIYWTTVPSGVTDGWPQVIMDGTTQCYTSQDPNPTDRFLFDVVGQWRVMSPGEVDTTSITDTGYFTQASSSYWDEASVGIWVTGNAAVFRPVLTFTPGTDTITFATISPYEDRDSYFAMFNHPALIDQAGETAVNVAANRLYVWPPDSGDMSGHTWSVGSLANAFLCSDKNNLVIDNFKIRGYFSGVGAAGYTGCAVSMNNSSATNGRNNIVSDCEITLMKSMDRDWLVTLSSGNAVQAVRNTITNSFGGGIYTGGADVVIADNVLDTLTGTGIYTPSTTDTLITRNSLTDIQGTHANGMSIYSSSDTVEVSFNIIRNSPSLLTFEASSNLTFINNLIDANNKDQRINGWSGLTGTITFYNNTFVNNSNDTILNFVTPTGDADFVLRNNIIDGGGRLDAAGTRSHNIYTGLHGWQTGPSWTLQTGESIQTDADLFTTAGSVFTLKSTSPAVNAGTNLSAYFTTDITGATRTGWDIGAYDYVGGNFSATTLNITNLKVGP